MPTCYPNLAGEIARRGIKKKAIASSIHVCEKSFWKKMNGKVPFTWPEVKTIRKTFFPDMDVAYLFAEDGEEQAG